MVKAGKLIKCGILAWRRRYVSLASLVDWLGCRMIGLRAWVKVV